MTDNTLFYRSAFSQSFSNQNLQLIIFPTEQCNFRCTYCYEDFKIGRMDGAVIEGIKNLISSRPDLLNLNLMWFGGEPTAAVDIVYDISTHARDFCFSNKIRLSGHMTTNGYRLDVENLSRLVSVGIDDFQITLDGSRAFHDATRRLANYGGTYDKIISNLLSIRDSEIEFHVCLRVHISRTNISNIETFIEYIDDQFLGDRRFSINIHPVEPLSRNAELNREALPTAVVEPIVSKLADRTRGAKHGYSEDNSCYVCYAAMPNSFAIRADGRIGKCTVALDSDKNTIGRILPTGELVIDNKKHLPWLKGWSSFDTAALACPVGTMK